MGSHRAVRRRWVLVAALAPLGVAGCRASTPKSRRTPLVATPAPVPPMMAPGSMAAFVQAIRARTDPEPVHELYLDTDQASIRTSKYWQPWTPAKGWDKKTGGGAPSTSRPIDPGSLPLVDLPEFIRRAMSVPGIDTDFSPTLTIHDQEAYGLPSAFMQLGTQLVDFDHTMQPRPVFDLDTLTGATQALKEVMGHLRPARCHWLTLEPDGLTMGLPNLEKVTRAKAGTMVVLRQRQSVRTAAEPGSRGGDPSFDTGRLDLRHLFAARKLLKAAPDSLVRAAVLPDAHGAPQYHASDSTTGRSVRLDASGARL